MISVIKGVAHPWQCDVMGHFTTRYYVALFDDASYHFLNTVFGWTGNRNINDDAIGEVGWADVKHVINYLAEVSAGDLLEVQVGLEKLGSKSITVKYEMLNVASGERVADLTSTSVLFDLNTRKACRIPEAWRQKAGDFIQADAAR